VLRIKKRRRSPSPRVDYYLDESDPDIVVLRRQDGSYVAAFGAIGATREGIVEAAREDYAALVKANAGHLASFSEKRHSA
jgi:hypothetical protein